MITHLANEWYSSMFHKRETKSTTQHTSWRGHVALAMTLGHEIFVDWAHLKNTCSLWATCWIFFNLMVFPSKFVATIRPIASYPSSIRGIGNFKVGKMGIFKGIGHKKIKFEIAAKHVARDASNLTKVEYIYISFLSLW